MSVVVKVTTNELARAARLQIYNQYHSIQGPGNVGCLLCPARDAWHHFHAQTRCQEFHYIETIYTEIYK